MDDIALEAPDDHVLLDDSAPAPAGFNDECPPAHWEGGCGRANGCLGALYLDGEPEGAADTLRARYSNLAAHHHSELLRDCEPRPGAPVAADHGSRPPGRRRRRGGAWSSSADPNPGVLNDGAQDEPVVFVAVYCEIDEDLAVIREFDGVGDEVVQDLAEAVGISGRGLRQRWGAPIHELEVLVVGTARLELRNLLQDHTWVEGGRLEGVLARPPSSRSRARR